ncbi:hypothetical protein QYF61_014634 [Mycteria americana]|uniref:PPM-type phosphatase domain-containing protein n=1 Tax=Mycteria americana TaxID=33587 RepID=A0AAN7N4T3_MYCAM|nr:hypothetical protein QYF61_014634 [Mycteria americana]
MGSLGQRLCWRSHSVELEGKKPPAVTANGIFNEHTGTTCLIASRSLLSFPGTTCLIALLSDKELTVANVGDSRGVLCDKDGNAIPLSHDHKPYQLKERKRIKRAGGFISFNGSWRVQGILAMSRSLGDYPLKNLNVVIPDPDILTFDLDKLQPEFMILASDGLWDAFSNEEAVRFIKERLDEPHFGAKSIVLQSFYRGCPDNITVMVVKFRNSSKTEEQ